MINFNGYYINLAKKVFDSRIGDNLMSISALIFYKNYTYKILSKQEYSKHIKDFCITELIDDGKTNGVFSINEDIITLKPNDKHGNSYILSVLSNDKLYNSITKSNMVFISWKEHIKIKEIKNNNDILKKILQI
jgi:hypothetical protein